MHCHKGIFPIQWLLTSWFGASIPPSRHVLLYFRSPWDPFDADAERAFCRVETASLDATLYGVLKPYGRTGIARHSLPAFAYSSLWPL